MVTELMCACIFFFIFFFFAFYYYYLILTEDTCIKIAPPSTMYTMRRILARRRMQSKSGVILCLSYIILCERAVLRLAAFFAAGRLPTVQDKKNGQELKRHMVQIK